MWLVLCSPADVSALWAGEGLRARGVAPLEYVSPVELACARRLEYRAGASEPPRGIAELSSGLRLETRGVRGALNRAMHAEFPQVRRAAVGDRAYARGEMEAILLAWLSALPGPLFNPPAPSGWCGAQRHPFGWALLAQRAGFEAPGYRCGFNGLEFPPPGSFTTTTHLVFQGQTYPLLPTNLHEAAVRLAALAGLPLMGLTLARDRAGAGRFAGAGPIPDLRVGGADFLDALATAFTAT